MFTGIVEETGAVVAVDEDAGGRRLRIAADAVAGDLRAGGSIAVSGVCLTVEAFGEADGDASGEADADGADADAGAGWFEVFLAEETVERTYLGDLGVGDRVNLERSVPVDGRLDGHVVQGHVDTVTEVVDVRAVGDDWRFAFAVPEGYGRYVAEKGSIALDGVSLTVASRDADTFDVAIIPTTYELTTFSALEPGDPVHVEIDVLARYAERLLAEREGDVPLAGPEAGTQRG